jgi:RNA recognition motif-containing protein
VFVGNLSFDVTREELFEDEESVPRCIDQMHGKDLKGRPLRVNEAEDRPPRSAGGPGSSRGPAPRGPGAGPRPSPGYRAEPPPDFPPAFEKDDRGGGRNKRFSQKPSKRRSSRRRRDQVADDEDY